MTFIVNSVNDLFRILVCICRFTGLITFSFKYNEKKEVENVYLTLFDKILSTFWYLFYTILFGVTFLIKKPQNIFWLSFWIYTLDVCFANAIGALNVITNLYNRKNILFMIQHFHACDEELKKFNVIINHKYHLQFVLIRLMASISMTAILTVLTHFFSHAEQNIWNDILKTICYTTSNIAISVISFVYSFTLMGISIRFKHLNQCFK